MNAVRCVSLDGADNVVLLPGGGDKGSAAGGLRLVCDVPPGHKVARVPIPAGAGVVKHGGEIGFARRDIAAGEWVHLHNLASRLSGALDPLAGRFGLRRPWVREFSARGREFLGFRRHWGKPGVRNELWVIPTAGCVCGTVRRVLDTYRKPFWIDAVRFAAHPYGSGRTALPWATENLLDVLSGLALNPNAAGVLLVEPGDAGLSAALLRERIEEKNVFRNVKSISLAGEDVGEIPLMLDKLAVDAPRTRERFPLADLRVGMLCGDVSDVDAAISCALLGRFADFLTGNGGAVLASATPVLCGADAAAASRIGKKATFEDFMRYVKETYASFRNYGLPVCRPPSAEAAQAGITTCEEAALAALAASGHAPLTRVLALGEQVGGEDGVRLVPGASDDLVSATSLAASGAQLVLSAGRGALPPPGVVPALAVSLATPSPEHAEGRNVSEPACPCDEAAWKEEAARLRDAVLDTANGRLTEAEIRSDGEIAVFLDGVTL